MYLAKDDRPSTLIAAFGDPGQRAASTAWEAESLVLWTPPYPMFYSDKARTPMRRMRVHKKALPIFKAAFGAVLAALGHDYIVKHRLDVTAGTTVWRKERGGSALSVHSWGIAIDIDPARNPFPSRWAPGKGMIDATFAEIMQARGFWWRGRPGDIDPMHFQLVPRIR